MTDVVEQLRKYPVDLLDLRAADEIERLRAQNAILMCAIEAAARLMESAPAWHQMHREVIAGLQAVKREMES